MAGRSIQGATPQRRGQGFFVFVGAVLTVLAGGSAPAAEVDLFGDGKGAVEMRRMGPDHAPARLVNVSVSGFNAILRASSPATTRLTLPSGQQTTLTLSPRRGASVVAPGAVFEEVGPGGVSQQTPLVAPDVLVGSVDGASESLVVLTRVGPFVFGRVEMPGTTYDLVPADTTAMAASPEIATVIAPAGTAPQGSRGCQVDQYPKLKRGLPPRPDPLFTNNLFSTGHLASSSSIVRMAAPDRTITVGIDTTYETWQRAGNSTLLQYYITAMMTQVDAIYRRDLETAMVISGIRTFTTPADPYGSDPDDSFTYLLELGAVMDNVSTPSYLRNASIAHVIHSDGSDILGGIAWIDVLCSSDRAIRTGFSNVDLDYSYPTGSFTWDVSVVAHEMGHNVGSPHTHCYSPPIDQCYNGEADDGCYAGTPVSSPGTIMSYCHLINGGTVQLLFSQREKDLMRAAILAGSCLAAGAPPPTYTATPAVTPTPTPTPPPNDNFANAQTIVTSLAGTNVGATKQSGEPTHVYSSESGSVWYNWTSPGTGSTRLHTCGSALDSVLAIYTGGAVNALTKLASNDDSTNQCNGTYQSEVNFNATLGTTYRVAVAGYPGETGTFTLYVVPPPTPTPTPSPSPTPSFLNGDADANGTINVADLTMINNRIAGFIAVVPGDGDLDNDGDIDVTDANLLRALLVP